MAVEQINLTITQSTRFWLQPGVALTVFGVGVLRHGFDGNLSRIRLRPQVQAIGPFMDRVEVMIEANGDVSYSLYDLNAILSEDLAPLTTLAVGTRAWEIYGVERYERYWNGVAWVPKSWALTGTDVPSDDDGRPDGVVYFQVG